MKLNQRQIDIVQMLSKDYDAVEIAELINSTVGAVHTECQRIREIVGVKKTWGLTAEALRQGWIV